MNTEAFENENKCMAKIGKSSSGINSKPFNNGVVSLLTHFKFIIATGIATL